MYELMVSQTLFSQNVLQIFMFLVHVSELLKPCCCFKLWILVVLGLIILKCNLLRHTVFLFLSLTVPIVYIYPCHVLQVHA